MTSLADPGIPDSDLRLIAVMPLHTITTLHGERGLRARLAIEAERLFSVADREKIGEAVQLAAVLHEHDSRQREPFINHLLRVALRILIHYDVADVDITCAAVLRSKTTPGTCPRAGGAARSRCWQRGSAAALPASSRRSLTPFTIRAASGARISSTGHTSRPASRPARTRG